MKWLKRQPQVVGNVRRTKKIVPVKKPRAWLGLFKQSAWFVLVTCVVGTGIWKLNQQMTVTHWQVESPMHIKKDIEQYFAQKQNFDYWHTRASLIQADLLARIPDIQNIAVSRILPEGLLVKVIARQPVALWVQGEDTVMLVDEQGEAYRALKRGESLDLPILRLLGHDLVTAVQVLYHLRENTPRKAVNLSEVIHEHGSWRLNFSRGEQWQFNQASLQKDLPKVLQILDKPRWARGHWRMDARISGRWFIRPAKQEVI